MKRYLTIAFVISLVLILQIDVQDLSAEIRILTITASVIDPNAPPPNGGGGGGGGGGGYFSMPDAVVFKGLAYPGSKVILLKNSVIVAEVPASPIGNFEIGLKNLSVGTYNFGIMAEDSGGLKSALQSFSIFVSSGITTTVDGIFIPPTITSDKVEVKKGDPIIILGKAPPSANITIVIHSDKEIIKKTVSNISGAWLYKVDSGELEIGDHESFAKAITKDDISPVSEILKFKVGKVNKSRGILVNPLGEKAKCDLNGDLRVNLLDFSIMAYWYKRAGFPVKVDLNVDKAINLTDFSILAYCWTG